MIEISKLTKTYDRGTKALKDVNITIDDGEFVFITGRSGSGKSTLIKILLKEVEPTSGRVVVNDMDLRKMPRRYVPKYRRRLGVVFQDFRLLKDKTVYENVAFAQRVIGESSRTIRESVPQMLKMVGLSSKYKFFPHQLSGGEQQRVAIARALINRPEILLADEPTGNLDPHNAMEIMGLLEKINRRGTTVIVVTHSHEIVDLMKKRVITIDRGMVVCDERKVGTVMRISTFWFCMKQGLVNICRNIWFSLASTAIISACIFLFCVFFSVITNIEYMVRTAETTMGITVFFDENLTEDEIKDIGAKIESDKSGMIKEIKFVSAEEAWDSFKTEYFGEDEALSEGFADDNPLAGSSSYEIRLNNIADQDGMVAYLKSIDGVRKVNYSNSAATGLASFNKILGLLFGVLIAILLAVAVFLISNTISVAAEFRKNENRIMRLIGATNFMIRAPFVVEGTILGLVGAAIPLGVMLFVYRQTVEYVMNRFELLSGIIQFLPLGTFYPMMTAIALALGGGLGFFVSFFTIRKELRV